MSDFYLKMFSESRNSEKFCVGGSIVEAQDIKISFEVRGEINLLEIPDRKIAIRADELWKNSCLELFVMGEGPDYFEWNFSPSGAWAFYSFSGYRVRVDEDNAPSFSFVQESRESDCWSTTYQFELPKKLQTLPRKDLQFSPAVILKSKLNAKPNAQQKDLTYWAPIHCGSHPDFHQRGSFVVRL